MRKSNQQNAILLGLVLILVVIYSSQGRPYPAFSHQKTTDLASKRQGVGYSSSSSPQDSADPNDVAQQSSYNSYMASADSQTPYSSDEPSAPASSSDQSSAPASSADQPSAPASSADQPSAPASSADQPSAPASSPNQPSAPASSADQPSAPASSAYQPSAPASSPNQPSAPASSADQPSAPASSADQPSAPASSPNQPSTPASPGDQPSAPASTASSSPQTPSSPAAADQQAKPSEQTAGAASPPTQDQSQAAQYPESPTQFSQSTQDQSQAAQTSQSQSQAPANTSQSGSYYTGSDQAEQTSAKTNPSSDYGNPPQPYDAAQNKNSDYGSTTQAAPATSQTAGSDAASSSNPQQNTPDYSRYELVNVTSKPGPDTQAEAASSTQAASSSPATATVSSSSISALGLPGNDSTGYGAVSRQGDNEKSTSESPVTLSASDATKVPDSSAPNTATFPTVSKETTMNGNHATTYLELPKHLHKPAIVKYEVQIAPKTKGVPIEQEIAIMPPEGTGGDRKPLVLLKQLVTKATDERIQIIVPKEDSSLVNSPKVEVKGGHVDEEDVNKGALVNQDREQGQAQDQGQGQGESQGQYPAAGGSEGFMCDDLPLCRHYTPTICNQEWMKRHCKKMCGLCNLEETSSSSLNDNKNDNNNPSPKHCEYGGEVHQSGETWSPGPCVPKCRCQDGYTNCSKVECPDLNCNKPVKRRWKCCPECLPNPGSDTGCGVDTLGGNAEGLCCVFPFNYRNVDYFTCTTADSNEPWCSITRNYDRDGLWGTCVVKSKIEANHSKETDSDEKSALLLAAQLSNARIWRNSSNNQVSKTLKSLPNLLSQKAHDSLNEGQMLAYRENSRNPSDYNAYADKDSWNDDNGTAPTQASTISGLGNLIDPNSKNSSETTQGSSTLLLTSSSTTSSTSLDQQPLASPYTDQNASQQSTTAYYDQSSSTAPGTYSDPRDTSTGYRALETSTPEKNSYGNKYPQGNPASDSTDNVVPNGIENQTSYEMHPDASTAQYGSDPTPTT